MPTSVVPPLVSDLQYFSGICAKAIGCDKPENLYFLSIQSINQIHRDALLNTSVLLDTLPLGDNCATVLSTSIRKSHFNQLSIRLMHQKDVDIKYALLCYFNNFGTPQYILVVPKPQFRKLIQYAIRTGRDKLKLEAPVLYDNVIKKINDLVMGVKKDLVYKDYGIRLNRGLIFYGPPGNGKTFASKYIQQLCAKHLIQCGVYKTVDIESAYRDNKLAQVFNSAHVQIFDDVDINLFVRKGANTVTSSILSAMDGPTITQKACLRVFTTNEDIDNMDYAFLRPGRIDTCIKIDKPDEKLTRVFWERWKNKPKELAVEKLVKASADMSFAQMEFLKIVLVQNFQENDQWNIQKAVEVLRASYSNSRGKIAGFREDTCCAE